MVGLMQRASHFLDAGDRYEPDATLAEKIIANLFLENSTRTRCSFTIAAKRLGGDVVDFALDSAQDELSSQLAEVESRELAYIENALEQMREGNMWFINGKAATGHMMDPLLLLQQGTSHVLQMDNRTAWHHPMHLHGHSFRVIARNGQPTRHREWQDTVLLAPEERVEIAFVADNPGDWMFHCHILEHQAAGMMGIIRVDPGTTKT